jgi:hypothetical protein
LARVYRAIASYLNNQAEIDKYLEDREREFEGNAIPLEQDNPVLWEKIRKARTRLIAEEHRGGPDERA